MSRTRITALTLVNWRGVFYRTLDFHPQVTALEGPNGAGKTTLMIAAYAVLMPEIRRLRFTPLGAAERRSGDRGLWGRLQDGHCYSALDLTYADGRRLLAVVHLLRGPASSEKVEITPLVVEGLAPDADLQALFLQRAEVDGESRDKVRSWQELCEAARTEYGAVAHRCTRKADYYRHLFDAGLHPLELGDDDASSRFNNLLKTSMTGGLSQQLDSGLRDFLFRPDPHLGSSLRTMRKALDDCRETRAEVEESQRLHAELSDVLEAGQAAFSYAVGAVEARAAERARMEAEARKDMEESRARLEELRSERAVVAAALTTTTEQQEAASREQELARDRLERLERGVGLVASLKQQVVHVAELRQRREARREECRGLGDRLQSAEEHLAIRRGEHEAAARGLGKAEEGLEHLQQLAAAYRYVRRKLDEVEGLLGEPLRPEASEAMLRSLDERYARSTDAFNELATECDQAARHRETFEGLRTRLERCLGRDVRPTDAEAEALSLLETARRREGLLAERPQLETDLRAARGRAEAQARARARAQELSLPDEALLSSGDVDGAEGRARAAEEGARAERQQLELESRSLFSQVEELRAREARLENRLRSWAHVRARAGEVAARLGYTLTSSTDIDEAEQRIDRELEARAEARRGLSARVAELAALASRLEAGQGELPEALADTAAALGGRLLAERFEQVSVDEAASAEARLGDLAEAILVSDLESALHELHSIEERPDRVLLLDARAAPWSPEELPEVSDLADGVAAQVPFGFRWERLPAQPRLGKAARRRRLDQVRREHETTKQELQALERRLGELREVRGQLRRLREHVELLEAPDPAPELEAVRQDIAAGQRTLESVRTEVERVERELRETGQRARDLRALLKDAHLLDLPDQREEVKRLQARLSEAEGAQSWLRAHRADLQAVDRGLPHLGRQPLSEDELATHRARLGSLRDELRHLQRVLEPLREVVRRVADFAHAGAEEALAEERAVLETLTRATEQAHARLREAELARDAAKRALEDAQSALRRAEEDAESAVREVQRLRQELEALDCGSPSPEDVAQGRELLEAAASAVDAAIQRLEALQKQDNQLEVLEGQAADSASAAEDAHKKTVRPAQAAVERWQLLREACEERGLLGELRDDLTQDKNEVSLNQLRDARQLDLQRALARVRAGSEVLEHLVLAAGEQGDDEADARATQALTNWQEVRAWLLRRLPAHVFQGTDVVAGIHAMRDTLASLRETLAEREELLRGSSRKVANQLAQRIRGAHSVVRSLNPRLRQTGFGNIARIELKLERNAQMQSILDALRADDDANLLFGTRPIDEVLDELYSKVGGRDGRRLLDYRAYLDLTVRIQRKGSQRWEEARGARMSTGETIGVGSAVMMVVLQAWEDDGVSLRPRKGIEACRFLFLDEATRLSRDNLSTLFSLCESLDLQMLIAAPEVQEAQGNWTYHLERRHGPNGAEEVLMTGRREVAP